MKVLFLYTPEIGTPTVPLGISMLSASLKRHGHETRVFDTTFISLEQSVIADAEKVGMVKKTDMARASVFFERKDVLSKFKEAITEFEPDLVGLSATSLTWPLGLKLLRTVQGAIPTIVGGPHATVCPQEVLQEVDMVCVGEGEEALVELCQRMANGEDITGIANLWLRKKGTITMNAVRPLSKLDDLPYPDWIIFDDRHFYKPFMGKVYRAGNVEISRGCLFSCTYCITPYMHELYRGKGGFHREKSIERVIAELAFLAKAYKLEMFNFADESFLTMSRARLRELSSQYARYIGLPFIISTHPNTVTLENAKILRDMNCVAVTIGIESGNDEMRRKVLNRKVTRHQLLRSFEYISDAGMRVTSFNIIGLPFENRRQIFDTIELNRLAKSDSSAVYFFYPYLGTKLREISEHKGFLAKDAPVVPYEFDTVLSMPQISGKELHGLRKTFNLYTRVPKALYPLVRICERDNLVSNFLFKILVKFYGGH